MQYKTLKKKNLQINVNLQEFYLGTNERDQESGCFCIKRKTEIVNSLIIIILVLSF